MNGKWGVGWEGGVSGDEHTNYLIRGGIFLAGSATAEESREKCENGTGQRYN